VGKTVASRQERRRRRHIERRLRELDRLDRNRGIGTYPAVRSRRAVDWRGVIAFGVTVALLVLLVHAVPAVAPVWLREAIGAEPHRLAPAVAVRTTGSFAFIAHQPGAASDPVAWDPCRPIRYVINPAGGPAGGIGIAEQAVSRMAQVSGLKFEYRGKTGERPHWNSPVLPIIGTHRPMLISWATADEVPQLSGDVAGIGGSVPVATRDGGLRYATGGITLDAGSFAQLAEQPEGQAEERAIILHELGHVVGLAHVADPAELMNADNLGLLDYGSGDLAGLARLGNGRCF
jgi:hypothetical protein